MKLLGSLHRGVLRNVRPLMIHGLPLVGHDVAGKARPPGAGWLVGIR